MRKLEKPNKSVNDVLDNYSSKRTDIFSKIDFQALKSHLIQCEKKYQSFAELAKLHEIKNILCLGQELLPDFYEKYFLKQTQLRTIYDEIKLIPQNSECPYCGIVKGADLELDHYLSKKIFTEYAITPQNLVPCCSQCNKSKLDRNASCQEEQILHPYFDDFASEEQWLFATCTKDYDAIIYICKAPESWSQVNRERILYHFNTFNLARNYGMLAAQEIRENDWLVKDYLYNKDREGLAHHFYERFLSLNRHYINAWKTALYQLLAKEHEHYEAIFKITIN